MAKVHARNVALFAGGREISGRSNSATLTQNADAPDATAFKDSNRERLHLGIRDIELSVNGFFDAAASQVDVAFNALLGASAYWGLYPEGTAESKGGGREFIGLLSEYSSEFATADAAATSITVGASGAVAIVKSLYYGTISSTGGTAASAVDFSGSSAS